jgi:uncharacterized protein (DUF2141 family)
MKTAMQDLLTYILVDCRNENGAIQFNAHETFNKFLEKEKEQIQKAFSDGQETPINHPTLPHYSREEYYNDNYNQNK